MPLLQVDSVFKDYKLGKTTVHALRGVNLAVKKGEFTAIAGPSGSGKTTLLHLIGCIEVPTEGRIFIDGKDVTSLDADELADFRLTHLGFIFQTFNLIPVLTALENVEFPLFKHAVPKAERVKRSMELLDTVGLSDYAKHKPEELSGGQRQRVAIARALVTRPQLVLADEPTANLDHDTGAQILQLMKAINKRHGTTFIFSTHDPLIIEQADRTIHIVDGVITTD
uniref:ABC transporter ATP-binding protein n=1 Tax=Desulfacinum infernum TaxID=35837 RepID=A0A832A8G2_9BACT